MFLRAGVIPQVGWIDAAEHFIQKTGCARGGIAAVSVAAPRYIPELPNRRFVRVMADTRSEQAADRPAVYDAIGGHSDGADAERALFRRLGRRRLAVLATTVTVVRQDT
jgi:hypothetical protein